MRQGTLVTAPVEEPVDVPTLKLHLRVDLTDDDSLITDYQMTARLFIEEAYDRALTTQTWDFPLDAFPWGRNGIELPIWPVQSVTSVTYTDVNGTPTVWNATNYFVDTVSKPARLVLAAGQGWPSVSLRAANGVVIRYVAGYGAASAVPWTTKTAIMLLVGHWYQNREPIMALRGVTPVEIPFTVRALLGTAEIAGVS